MTIRFKMMAFLRLAEAGGQSTEEMRAVMAKHAVFRGASLRQVQRSLRELRRDGLVGKGGGAFFVNRGNPRTASLLSFLLWCRKDGVDPAVPLAPRTLALERELFVQRTARPLASPPFSKATVIKILRQLEQIRFLIAVKHRPLQVKAAVTDKTLLLAAAEGFSLAGFQRLFLPVTLPKKLHPRLQETLIKLHVYSTTVTEGNTATEQDVERVLRDERTGLSPREIIEIVNAKRAIKELLKAAPREELTVSLLKQLHAILMVGLVERPGEFSYVPKRVIGSATRFPDSALEIDAAMEALVHCYQRYNNTIHPAVLAALLHFLLVSIHPFLDGNGRVARLLHSFVLVKAGLPLFAFDPEKRNRYFDLLEQGRAEDAEGFVRFCLAEHAQILAKLLRTGNRRKKR